MDGGTWRKSLEEYLSRRPRAGRALPRQEDWGFGMADRIPEITEDETRDLLPAGFSRGSAAHVEAYPSDRKFVDSIRTNRIFASLVVGSLLVVIGAFAEFVGNPPYAVLFLGIGGLSILYGVALRQGWFRMRWWL